MHWVSERLLLNAKWAIFYLYHDENKLHFVLCQHAEFGFSVPAHWNNNPRVLTCRTTQIHYYDSESNSLCSYPLIVLCWAEKQQIPILYSVVWHDRGSNLTNYRTRGRAHLTITPQTRLLCYYHSNIIHAKRNVCLPDSS